MKISLALGAAVLMLAAPAAHAATPTASIEGRTLAVVGTARADVLALRIDPTSSNRLDVDVGDDGTAEFSFAHKTFRRIRVEGGDGRDEIRIDDAITAPATIDGGDGGDTVDGGGGDDKIELGAGPDRFTWEPGDGDDSVRGGDGSDRATVDGSDDRETFRLVAKGAHARLTRDVDDVAMPLREVERVDVRSAGNNDNLTVGDLTGTGVTTVTHDTARTPGGSEPDLSFDTTTVKGSNGEDAIFVQGAAGHAKVTGLAATVRLHHSEVAHDTLVVEARRAADTIDTEKLRRDAVQLTADGGGDEDVLIGGRQGETLLGGGADDAIFGNGGDDVAEGGAGDDTVLLGGGADRFTWRSGDGDDSVEGQSGQDTLAFTGTDASERINLSDNGGRLRVTRNIAHITLDANRVETVELDPSGGEDRLFVGDLRNTAVSTVRADLTASGFGPDLRADEVTVDGSDDPDVVSIDGTPGFIGTETFAEVVRSGLIVVVTNPDPTLDRLTYRARGGDDVVIAAGLHEDVIGLQIDGGDGEDNLVGGDGDDTIFGGPKDDALVGGPGNDTLDGGPGTDTVIQD